MMILDKLVALRCRNPGLFAQFCDLVRNNEHKPVLAEIERVLADGAPDPAGPIADWLKKLRAGDLLDTFCNGPKLSEQKRDDLLTLTKFSDVRPDSKTMFQTNDPAFMRLVEISKQGPVIIDKLMFDDFCQLGMVGTHFPDLWNELFGLAIREKPDWTQSTLAVENFLLEPKSLPSDPETVAFAKAASTAAFPDGTPLASILLAPPRFSTMLADEVIAYYAIRPELPDASSLIDKQYTPSPSLIEKGRVLAKHALEALKPETKEHIEQCYKLMHNALNELTNRRIFVKRDILEHLQPSLYDNMQRDFAGFLRIEKQIQRPDMYTEAELTRLRPYLEDERLVRVLSLQPYFGHLMDSVPAVPLTATAEHIQANAPSGGPLTVSHAWPLPQIAVHSAPIIFQDSLTTAGPVADIGAGQTVPAFVDASESLYEDIYISLRRSADPNDTSYNVELKNAATPSRTVQGKINLDWAEIEGRLRRLQFSQNAPVSRGLEIRSDLAQELKELGIFVYGSIFQGDLRDELLALLSKERNLRLNWLGDPAESDITDFRARPAAAVFPWECLFVPPAPVSFLALTRRYSLTRRFEVKTMPVSGIGQNIRVLFVSATPDGVAPLPGIQQEVETVHRVLSSSSRAKIEIIPKATVEDVQPMLREFRPHVFHFSGHGVYRPEVAAGTLIFQSSDGSPAPVSADQLAPMLYDNGVSLAILNGCDTGVSSTNNGLSSVAGALIKAGVPAVVATMREVYDEAATRFSREFYRTFLAGFTVEGCMGEARIALSLDNLDWSAYALFVGTGDLSKLRVSGPARSQGEPTSSRPNTAVL